MDSSFSFQKLRNLWDGQLKEIFKYFSPYNYRCIAYVNKQFLKEVQNHYRSLTDITYKIGDIIKHDNSYPANWLIQKDMLFNSVLKFRKNHHSSIEQSSIFYPISYKLNNGDVYVYGWIIDNEKVDKYGRYPIYFVFRSDKGRDNMLHYVSNVIPYRLKRIREGCLNPDTFRK